VQHKPDKEGDTDLLTATIGLRVVLQWLYVAMLLVLAVGLLLHNYIQLSVDEGCSDASSQWEKANLSLSPHPQSHTP